MLSTAAARRIDEIGQTARTCTGLARELLRADDHPVQLQLLGTLAEAVSDLTVALLAEPDSTALADRRAQWHALILRTRGEGATRPNCFLCKGTGIFGADDRPCHRCYPEWNPPYWYLHPRPRDSDAETRDANDRDEEQTKRFIESSFQQGDR